MQWLSEVKRKKCAKKMFKNTLEGRRSVEKPRKRWLDDAGNDLKRMDVTGRRKIAKNIHAWKFILKEARTLPGQYSQWREEESGTQI